MRSLEECLLPNQSPPHNYGGVLVLVHTDQKQVLNCDDFVNTIFLPLEI